ncbi:MAG: site-2 protease family protein [Chloroflexi bacterium]|nr:site-2 protease family protein [Chloroflexota bacterium]
MRQKAIPIGRIMGIPVGLDYSWFLIFGLMTWSLAASYFPATYRDWSTLEYWLVGAVTTILLFVSVLLHELGHSAAARRFHIPVRRITLFIFGGVAEIGKEPPNASAEFWIALAGPVVSLALAILFMAMRPFAAVAEPLLALTTYLGYINGSLVLFNLIPGFPLDGGRVFRAIVWGITKDMRQATLIAANVGRFIAFLFIVAGVGMAATGNFINGLWIMFIGWFLESAAVAQVQQQELRDVLSGYRVYQAMSRDYVTIPAYITLEELVNGHILQTGRRHYVVVDGGRAIGLLTLHQIKQVPQSNWRAVTAGEAALPLSEIRRVGIHEDLWSALQEMDRDGVNQLFVMENGRLVGMLSREDIISFLRTVETLRIA